MAITNPADPPRSRRRTWRLALVLAVLAALLGVKAAPRG